MKYCFIETDSPVGLLILVAHEKALVAILWEKEKPNRVVLPEMIINTKHPILLKTKKQLEEYFKGKRKIFDIPLDPQGTEFQIKIWNQLRKIPFGKTQTYGEIAKKIGNPHASRAVGAANGKNPISIIVPCHRVIGSNGSLTGFAGGIEAKEILINREKIGL